LCEKYHEPIHSWPLHINEMEETLYLACQKLVNELGEKEEVLDTSQKDMKCSFDATSSHVLQASHQQCSPNFKKHTNDFGSKLLHHMGYTSKEFGKHG